MMAMAMAMLPASSRTTALEMPLRQLIFCWLSFSVYFSLFLSQGSPMDVFHCQTVFISCYLFIYLLSNGLSDIWKFQYLCLSLLCSSATNKHNDGLGTSTSTSTSTGSSVAAGRQTFTLAFILPIIGTIMFGWPINYFSFRGLLKLAKRFLLSLLLDSQLNANVDGGSVFDGFGALFNCLFPPLLKLFVSVFVCVLLVINRLRPSTASAV